MTVLMKKALALCGLCAVFASAGSAASAQGYHHHQARHAIVRQKAAYARAVSHGNYRAAERAHLRARAIRHHVRTHHHMMHHGY